VIREVIRDRRSNPHSSSPLDRFIFNGGYFVCPESPSTGLLLNDVITSGLPTSRCIGRRPPNPF
jgi:hypothetical protein